jgi:hypothetical protein
MIKKSFAFVLLLCTLVFNQPLAQAATESKKVYSGYLHQLALHKKPFWQVFGSKDFPKQDAIDFNRSCTIEFDYPDGYSNQQVVKIPRKLKYILRFKGEPAFKKYVIHVFSNDFQDYTIDPLTEGKDNGIEGEHHFSDAHIIYMILSHAEVDHLEIASADDETKAKYVLDKFEIHE